MESPLHPLYLMNVPLLLIRQQIKANKVGLTIWYGIAGVYTLDFYHKDAKNGNSLKIPPLLDSCEPPHSFKRTVSGLCS